MLNTKKVVLTALFTSFATSQLLASFTYNTGDVLICFRKSNGANDLVVDAGPIANFTNAAPNTRITIGQYTATQLNVLGYNSLIFSAFTWVASGNDTGGNNQLFMTRPRTSLNTQTAAFNQIPSINSVNDYFCANNMAPVPQGAAAARVANYNAASSDTAVIEPDDQSAYNTTGQNAVYASGGQSYAWALLLDGQQAALWGNEWGAGNTEKTTPSNFTTAGAVVRSDFYYCPPSGYGSVTFLGYFELNTNGVMTYVAFPTAAPTVPVIQSISRSNTVSFVKFSTGNSGTYTLRGTNSAGFSTPKTNWPAITTVAGTGSIATLLDTNSTASKFYVITAQ